MISEVSHLNAKKDSEEQQKKYKKNLYALFKDANVIMAHRALCNNILS